MGGPANDQPGSARQVRQERHVRDGYHQTRADRWPAIDRAARDCRERPQRRIPARLPSGRRDRVPVGRVYAGGAQHAAAGRAQPVRGEPEREHPAAQAERSAIRAGTRPRRCHDGRSEGRDRPGRPQYELEQADPKVRLYDDDMLAGSKRTRPTYPSGCNTTRPAYPAAYNRLVSDVEHKAQAPASVACVVLRVSDSRTPETDTGG